MNLDVTSQVEVECRSGLDLGFPQVHDRPAENPKGRRRGQKKAVKVADLFCGAGGSSTGAKRALERLGFEMDLVCVNHWPVAIETHKQNHPEAKHYCQDVSALRPMAAVPEGYLDLLMASPSCFPEGTLILARHGLVDISSLQVGDLVLTHRGRWRPVTSVMSDSKNTIIVEGQGHDHLETTSEHPFYTRTRRYKHRRDDGGGYNYDEPTWTPASDLTKNHFWSSPISVPSCFDIPSIGGRKLPTDDESFWWLIGRYVADGWVRTDNGRGEIHITIGAKKQTEMDTHTGKFARVGSRCGDGELHWLKRHTDDNVITYSSNHKELANWIESHFGKGCDQKRVPMWIMSQNEAIRSSFLAGYLAGDGCVETYKVANSGKRTFCTTSKKLAIGMKLLSQSLGNRVSFYRSPQRNSAIKGRKIVGKDHIYRVQWTEDGKRIWGYRDELHQWTQVRGVKESGLQKTVFNISVEEDESYVADGIVVHNCTHHSKARGGRPTSDQQRMDPWHVITWLTELRVKRLLVENVEDFLRWGPVDIRTGKPVKSREGEYFKAWIRNLKTLGYKVDWRVLNAADYGDATTRERFFLQARCDGKPIIWPAPTHSKNGSGDLFGNGAARWRAAREIIDWDTPGKSLWGRKRGLASKTIDRTLAGARKFRWPAVYVSALLSLLRQQLEAEIAEAEAVLAADLPEAKDAKKAAEARQTQARSTLAYATKRLEKLREEMQAQEPTGCGPGEPIVVTLRGTDASQVTSTSRSVDDTLPTITANGTHLAVAEPAAEPFVLGQQTCSAPRGMGEPIPTVATAGAIRLFTPDMKPVVVYVTGGDRPKAPHEVDGPLRTITTHNGAGVVEPTATLVPLGNATPMVAPYYGDGSGKTCASIEEPLDTVTTKARFGLVEARTEPFVFPVNQGHERMRGHRSVKEPLPTIVTRDTFGMIDADAKPFLVPQFGEREGQAPRDHDIDVPLPAVTSHGAGALVSPASLATPDLHALTAEDLADLESLSNQGRLVLMDGQLYVIDIRFRMLNNKELARAMGFDDAESEYEFVGTQSDITRQIGNAVAVNMAAALVGAMMAH